MSARSRAPQPSDTREIAVFDAGVPDREALIASLRPEVAAIRLRPGGDGLAELATRLAGRHDIAGLHIVSHGAPGRIVLGDSVLSARTLPAHARLLQAIARHLGTDATIHLYGCRAGAGSPGRALVAGLSALTGAAVRASETPTGAATLGGDWELAVVEGAPGTGLAFAETAGYGHLLAAPVFSNLDGTPSFTEDSGNPATLDGDVTVADADFDGLNGGNGDYAGARLTIARNGGAAAEDSFGFDTSGASFTLSGGNLQASGSTFATFTNSGGTLTVDFTSSGTPATTALVNEVLQRITYSNTSDTPPGSAQLDWTFDDAGGGGSSDTGSTTVSITAVNDAPTLSTNTGATFNEGATKAITNAELAASDPEQSASALTFTLDTAPSNGTLFIDADGDAALDAGEELGGGDSFTQADIDNGKLFVAHDGSETTSDSFAVTVDDGAGGSTGSQTVDLTITPVNDAPTASDDSASAQSGQAVTIGVLGNDGDAEGDTLSVMSAATPGNGTVTVNGDGTVTYTSDAGFTGTDTFTYTVDDGNGGTDTGTVTVTVSQNANDAPNAQDDSFTATEDTAATLDVLANDSDADGDTLTVTLQSTPANGAASVNGDGTIAYTPDPDFAGQDSFTYTVSDGNGGTATADIAITVDPVNDAPKAAADSFTVPGEQASTLDVLANDEDVDGDALTVTLNNTPENATASVNADGTITFTPDEGFFGETSFDYTVTDTSGSTATATATVTVSGSAGLPDAQDDSFTVAEDSEATLDVLANDLGVAAGGAQVTLNSTPPNATAVVNDDGTIAFTPSADFFGETSFTYTVTTDDGSSATATVDVSVSAVNDAPKAEDDSFEVPDGIASAVDVLANDSDADQDALVVTLNDSPANGTARVDDDGRLVFTPDPGFSGENAVTYTVADGNGGSAMATVTFTVTDSGPDLQLLDLALTEQIGALYIGYFGRAPDPAGLDFWESQMTNALAPVDDGGLGRTPARAVDDVAEALRLDQEAQDLFPFLDPEVDPATITTESVADFVNAVFQNLFNREAQGTADDPETGLGFWVGEIQDRLDAEIKIGDIIVDIISGAQNADARTMTNKIAVADAYGTTLDPTDFEQSEARDIVAGVDGGNRSVQDALDEIDSLAAQPLLGDPVDPMLA